MIMGITPPMTPPVIVPFPIINKILTMAIAMAIAILILMIVIAKVIAIALSIAIVIVMTKDTAMAKPIVKDPKITINPAMKRTPPMSMVTEMIKATAIAMHRFLVTPMNSGCKPLPKELSHGTLPDAGYRCWHTGHAIL